MNRKAWDPQAVAEYDALLQRVIEQADGTGERVDLAEKLLHDAGQAHRYWAHEVEREARRIGIASLVKNYLKRTRVLFATGNAKVEKPRVVGLQRVSDDGVTYAVQALYETATFDELREKRSEVLRQVKAYTDTAALIDRLLALADMYPDVGSVDEALSAHGMSLDEYLSRPLAA